MPDPLDKCECGREECRCGRDYTHDEEWESIAELEAERRAREDDAAYWRERER